MSHYEQVKSMGREKYLAYRDGPESRDLRQSRLRSLQPRVEEIIATQDVEGRWISNGRIEMRTFIKNVQTLSDYLALIR